MHQIATFTENLYEIFHLATASTVAKIHYQNKKKYVNVSLGREKNINLHNVFMIRCMSTEQDSIFSVKSTEKKTRSEKHKTSKMDGEKHEQPN